MKIFREYVNNGDVHKEEIDTTSLLSIKLVTDNGDEFRISSGGDSKSLKLSSTNCSLSIDPRADNMMYIKGRR